MAKERDSQQHNPQGQQIFQYLLYILSWRIMNKEEYLKVQTSS